MMRLSEWLNENEITDEVFAARLRRRGHRVRQATVNRWRNGRMRPRDANLHAIVIETDGKVQAADFYG